MGCTSSSPSTVAAPGSTAAGNGSLKNGSVIEQANGIAASAPSNGHGNGSLDPDKMKSMNDMLTDAANLDAQSVKKDLEEVGENLREAVEEGTQMLMDEFSKDAQESCKNEMAMEPSAILPLSTGDQDPEKPNPASVEPDGSDQSKATDPETEGESEVPPVKEEAEKAQDGGSEPNEEVEEAEAEGNEKPPPTEIEKSPEEAAISSQS